MLKIQGLSDQEFNVDFDIDYYVPLSVVTYTEPLGLCFYRKGNMETSLIEIGIDENNGMIRGFSVIMFDAVFSGELPDVDIAIGTPVVDTSIFRTERIIDDRQQFSLGLLEDKVIIEFDDISSANKCIQTGNISFYTRTDYLIAICLEKLTPVEIEQLNEKIFSISA